MRSTLGIDADVPLVLNVGRLSFKKGLDLLLEAVAELPGVHLAIVGPDDGDGTRELLQRRASMPDLANRTVAAAQSPSRKTAAHAVTKAFADRGIL